MSLFLLQPIQMKVCLIIIIRFVHSAENEIKKNLHSASSMHFAVRHSKKESEWCTNSFDYTNFCSSSSGTQVGSVLNHLSKWLWQFASGYRETKQKLDVVEVRLVRTNFKRRSTEIESCESNAEVSSMRERKKRKNKRISSLTIHLH